MKLKINKIELISKNRIKINFNNSEYIEIFNDNFVRFNLYKGKEITQTEINEILFEDKKQYSINLALNYIRNMKTENQVEIYLSKNDIDKDIIEYTLEYLKENKYIDDYIYCKSYILDKLKFNKYGMNKIIYNLKMKNIDMNLIEDAISEIPSDIEFNNLINEIIKKNIDINDFNLSLKLKKSLYQKGYSIDLINKAFNHLKNQ